MLKKFLLAIYYLFCFSLFSYAQSDCGTCTSDQILDTSRGACNETLSDTPSFNMSISGTTRTISSNSIPNHLVGLFGNAQGSLNPNTISAQSETYRVTTEPQIASELTPLLSTTGTGPNAGPQYSFGVLLNGVELDPVAAEPFPHQGMMSPNVNWEWNLEALNVNLGLDCNNAHVQPTGKYHYHGSPTLFLESLNISANTMTLIGYAADGFPIYYKYAYSDANNSSSSIIEMTSSYRLKTGCRPGDGITAPCDEYNGAYSNDYEYVTGLGTLDEANGRTGITPEYPDGTYYYVLTDAFPSIPRYFRGIPSTDFTIGSSVTGDCGGADGGDDDNDGICKIDDCDDNDANVGAKQTVGTACDDGDANTINDQIQSDGCTCAGTTDPCANSGGDSDNDGICADDDCDDNDANVGAKQTAGTACDDGNSTTENDVIQADGCTCAGTTIDPCANSGGDADNDGICAEDDCDDNDANVGAKQTAGTTCDDGNSTTENDVIQADGCTCAGTMISNSTCDVPSEPTVASSGGRSVRLSWSDIENAVNYAIQIRFQGQERWLVTATVRSNKVSVYGPMRDYEYRIKSNCSDGESAYSAVWTFSIPTNNLTPIAESRSGNQQLEEILISEPTILYPNPIKHTLNLFFPAVAEKTQFVIFDSRGKQIYQQKLEVGTNNYSFSLDHLEAGYYLGVVKEAEKISFSERFIKL